MMDQGFPSAVAAVAAATVSAALHVRAEYLGPRWQVYLFKPLTTSLLVLAAVLQASAHGPRYQVAVVAGLVLSLAGDVFLMLPGDRFISGLASFLLAHVAYLVAFSSGIPLGTNPLLLLPLLAAGVLLVRVLWRGLGRLRQPVLLYSAVIVLMVWQAWARGWELRSPGSALAAAGAALFMASDSLLALDRFRAEFARAQAAIMATYVAAQALIALSVGVP
jgi:uncharacterized membrane protein YhhN